MTTSTILRSIHLICLGPTGSLLLLLPGLLLLSEHAVCQQVSFHQTTIDANPPRNPWVKIVADFNQDGYADIAIGGAKGPFVWYEYPSWRKRLVTEECYSTVDGEAADIDRDGNIDIVLGGVIWLENPGPDLISSKQAWNRHIVGNLQVHDVEVVDLNGDGQLDLVTRDQSSFGKPTGNQLQIWLQNDPDSWQRRDLECPHGEGLKVGDVDHDGHCDIIIGARWYQNPGSGVVKKRWNERFYTSKWTHPDAVVAHGDINGDGRADIVLTPAELQKDSYRIAWYTAPENALDDDWQENIVESEQETVVHALELADINNDHRLDIVVAEMHQGADPDEVRVYLNREKGTRWTRQVLSSKGSHDIALIDIGSDGDIDIVGANHGGPYQPVELWENLLHTK